MNLHFNLENYLQELQELLNISDEQALLDQAEELWGANDCRYLMLQTWASSAPQKFKKPASPPKPEPSNGGPTEPNVIVK
jgi:hypothetical protein